MFKLYYCEEGNNGLIFYNNELDEYTYWMHYYSFKAISPFYNKLVCEISK